MFLGFCSLWIGVTDRTSEQIERVDKNQTRGIYYGDFIRINCGISIDQPNGQRGR